MMVVGLSVLVTLVTVCVGTVVMTWTGVVACTGVGLELALCGQFMGHTRPMSRSWTDDRSDERI
jgi:hypothetical protein